MLKTKARAPDGSIAAEPGPFPTATRSCLTRDRAPNSVTLAEPELTDTSVNPSGVSASSRGRSPGDSLVRSTISPDAMSIDRISSSLEQATYRRRRRRSIAMPAGPAHVSMAATAWPSCLSKTVIVFEPVLVTKPAWPAMGFDGTMTANAGLKLTPSVRESWYFSVEPEERGLPPADREREVEPHRRVRHGERGLASLALSGRPAPIVKANPA